MKDKAFETQAHKAGIRFEQLDGQTFIDLVVLTNDNFPVSKMRGQWTQGDEDEFTANISWGVPTIHLENTTNNKDFKNITNKAIAYANEQCLGSVKSPKTGGDQFGF